MLSSARFFRWLGPWFGREQIVTSQRIEFMLTRLQFMLLEIANGTEPASYLDLGSDGREEMIRRVKCTHAICDHQRHGILLETSFAVW